MEVDKRVEELRSFCKDKGIPLTQQRLEVFRALAASHDHPSPEEIHIRMKKEFPTLSLATVYKNLESLSNIGFARKINPLSDHARYDADLKPHSHFICLSCKMIEDIDDSAIGGYRIPEPALIEHDITVKTIQFFGICKRCKNNI